MTPTLRRLPTWSELDNIWSDALNQGLEEVLQKRAQERWSRLVDKAIELAEAVRQIEADLRRCARSRNARNGHANGHVG